MLAVRLRYEKFYLKFHERYREHPVAGTTNTPSGVQIDVSGKKLTASHDSVIAVLGTAERTWSRTLDWFDDNPLQFALLIVLAMFAIVQVRKGRTDLAAMRTEYEMRREVLRSRQQPPLPLPPPENSPSAREITK